MRVRVRDLISDLWDDGVGWAGLGWAGVWVYVWDVVCTSSKSALQNGGWDCRWLSGLLGGWLR